MASQNAFCKILTLSFSADTAGNSSTWEGSVHQMFRVQLPLGLLLGSLLKDCWGVGTHFSSSFLSGFKKSLYLGVVLPGRRILGRMWCCASSPHLLEMGTQSSS